MIDVCMAARTYRIIYEIARRTIITYMYTHKCFLCGCVLLLRCYRSTYLRYDTHLDQHTYYIMLHLHRGTYTHVRYIYTYVACKPRARARKILYATYVTSNILIIIARNDRLLYAISQGLSYVAYRIYILFTCIVRVLYKNIIITTVRANDKM